MAIKNGSVFIFLHVDIQLCQHHLLNMLSFFHLVYFASLSKIRGLLVCRLISETSIQFHWSSCLSLCRYQAVFSAVALEYILKSGIVVPPEVLLLYRIVLAILGFLLFYMKLSIILSGPVKNCVGIVTGTALTL